MLPANGLTPWGSLLMGVLWPQVLSIESVLGLGFSGAGVRNTTR